MTRHSELEKRRMVSWVFDFVFLIVKEVWVNHSPFLIPLTQGQFGTWAPLKTALRYSINIWASETVVLAPKMLLFLLSSGVCFFFLAVCSLWMNVGWNRKWLRWRMERASSSGTNEPRAAKVTFCGPGERAKRTTLLSILCESEIVSNIYQ